MVYVVVACHFQSLSELCGTTVARLEAALKAAGQGDQFLLTGDVPYAPGGLTLGELMRSWLTERGISLEATFLLHGGVGTFSEARAACQAMRDKNEITVVSSTWYFQGKIIWQRRGHETDVKVSFLPVQNTGGWRTALTYAILGAIVHLAIALRCERVLENRLTASQKNRRDGFRFNGCR